MTNPTIQPNELVVWNGQRPIGAIVPLAGKYQARADGGRNLGAFASVAEVRRALIEADTARTA